MLKIRQEQFAAFKAQAEAAFEARLQNYLRTEHGEVSVELPHDTKTITNLPAEILKRLVHQGIERARRHGLTWESNISSFVVMMFVAAPNFDEHPLISRVLDSNRDDADAKFTQLWEQTTEENWASAKQNYQRDAWQM